MRVAETEGQFNDATARKVYRNDSVSILGKNFDQGTADSTCCARNDDNASCLHVEDFSRAPLSDFSQSILSGKDARSASWRWPVADPERRRSDAAAVQLPIW
ncbi:hypothetical protein MPL3365_170258 [Mesorhizobium plurifarium]|uniref:Uncharacterized protein n=1 Tax=Mesorhizobium plurifarium TaxID=69974 RepID=A0A090FZD3_MESPL|nr:hypothetical protein MPL3365_170258 [Mesorhizobium plurifarium]